MADNRAQAPLEPVAPVPGPSDRPLMGNLLAGIRAHAPLRPPSDRPSSQPTKPAGGNLMAELMKGFPLRPAPGPSDRPPVDAVSRPTGNRPQMPNLLDEIKARKEGLQPVKKPVIKEDSPKGDA